MKNQFHGNLYTSYPYRLKFKLSISAVRVLLCLYLSPTRPATIVLRVFSEASLNDNGMMDSNFCQYNINFLLIVGVTGNNTWGFNRSPQPIMGFKRLLIAIEIPDSDLCFFVEKGRVSISSVSVSSPQKSMICDIKSEG